MQLSLLTLGLPCFAFLILARGIAPPTSPAGMMGTTQPSLAENATWSMENSWTLSVDDKPFYQFKDGLSVTFGTDGNLVFSGKTSIWQSGTAGKPNSCIDGSVSCSLEWKYGNLAVWKNNQTAWSTRTDVRGTLLVFERDKLFYIATDRTDWAPILAG